MSSTTERPGNDHLRTYIREESIVFLKTKEKYGGLSNMASGYPLKVNGVPIRTSEALYQACRFPHDPDVQGQIISERSPMAAKMRSKKYREGSRSDWDNVRVKIMRWCLRVKLAQNWDLFGELLLKTKEYDIVEQSRRDDFWGARVVEDGTLVGRNVLGRLLMELREQLKQDTSEDLKIVKPLAISDFLLLRKPIEIIRVNMAPENMPLDLGEIDKQNSISSVVSATYHPAQRRNDGMTSGSIKDDDDVAALQALISGGASEGKMIEYKSEMPGRGDSDIVPFLASVSAIANTAGGKLFIGIEAKDGVPTSLPGIKIDNLDEERLRLEQILRNGLEPRLPRVDIEPVQVSNGRYVLVIRIPRSWNAPHRVKKNSKFYARNSAGRYELDVGELRSAFTLSETVTERIRSFRTDRIAKIYSGETPIPLGDGGYMVFHVLPLSAFTEGTMIDIAAYRASPNRLPAIDVERGLLGSRVNLDGIVTLEEGHGRPARAYTQLFRRGVAEFVFLLHIVENEKIFHNHLYEKFAINCLRDYFKFATEFMIEQPYYAFLSFVGVRGYRFLVEREKEGMEGWIPGVQELLWHEIVWLYPLERDMFCLPEVVIEDRDAQPQQLLRPIFDMVWNAFGFIRSLNFDEQGNWID